MISIPEADVWRRPAPTWLKSFTGTLLVPVLWLAFVWLVSTTVPVIEGDVAFVLLLIGTLVASGFLAWIIVREMSTRMTLGLSALALLTYFVGVWALLPLPGHFHFL
jgi:hypothetical protein